MLENYNIFSTMRSDKKGGGVVLYVHDSLKVNKIEQFSLEMHNILESITLEIIVESGKNVIVSCIYRTPGSDIHIYTDFVEQILNFVKNKTVYIIGDTNVDLLNCESHKAAKDFLDMMYTYGVYPQINKPTRITSFSTTLIDNIFTNYLSTNLKCGVLCNDISDHLPIFYVAEYKGISRLKKNL